MRRWICLALLLCSTVLLGNCASPLPDAASGELPRQQVRISTSKGWLTYHQSHQLIEKLGHTRGGDFLANHLQVEEAVAGAPLVANNAVTLYDDGPSTFQAMAAAIRGARHYIHLESYIFEDDEIGNRLTDLLIQKCAEGVPVAVMVDAVGTLAVPQSLFDRMKQAGIAVVVFNPINPFENHGNWSINRRSHRKILVVDGGIAFVGGINVSDVYASRPRWVLGSSGRRAADEKHAPWRDTHLRIVGPAAREVDRVFVQGWRSQQGPAIPDDQGPPAPGGHQVVRIIVNQPGAEDNHAIYLTLMSAFASAQRSIHITIAYFVPDPAFIAELCAAARRGVDVVLLLPGFSDIPAARYAGRSHYTELFDAGVKIYERHDALLHAKTAVIDGVWSTAGSSNLDWRSFTLNHEINAVVLGPEFGAQMESLFARDLRVSERIDPDAWAHRSFEERWKESVARLLERWL